jgi:hypothetical protein
LRFSNQPKNGSLLSPCQKLLREPPDQNNH